MKTKNILTRNLFELTEEQRQMSMSMYGKVIKCLIAPYHNITNIPLESNNEVYVYPERDLSIQQRKSIVDVMAKSAKTEICFVTSDVFIITDMIDSCCRILTPDGSIEEVKEKTFSANAHTILLEVLQDDVHVKKYKDEEKNYVTTINTVITAIQKKTMTQEEYDKNLAIINTIGEELISRKMKEMIREVQIIPTIDKDEVTGEVKFTSEEVKLIKNTKWFKDNLAVKNCIPECEKNIENAKRRIEIYEELIGLKKGSAEYADELKSDMLEFESVKTELKIKQKMSYWLSEQEESKKIQVVFK